MDRRFEVRKAEMLADCEVSPAVFQGITNRLEALRGRLWPASIGLSNGNIRIPI